MRKTRRKKNLIFVSSKETGEKILQELQVKKVRAIFLTADNKELEEQAKTIRTISEKKRFDSDVLIATAVLDVGVSIKDPDVNQIFIRSYNSEEFLQMLGRLRVPTDAKYEGITLFIHKIRKQDVDRRLGQERTYLQILEKARHSQNLDHDIASNEIMFADNCNPGIYNASHLRRMLLSPLALHRHRELFKRYKGISNAMSDNPDAFLLLQLRWLGLEEDYDVVNYVANDVREEIRKEVFLNREMSEAKK
ncbi:helicase-related protein [Jutongia sp.]|uniref:helicase-related protein n=1 Tax=Jutongia sp. TaxID=2944204 RepID=UPI003079E5F0